MTDRYFLAEAKYISWYLIPESRRREWFDLVRQGRLKEKVEKAKPGITVDESKYVLFGIPQRERDINSNLSQNPGY